MNGKAIFLWLGLGSGAFAQGFADMGATVPGFALPDPDRVLEFPADHAAHPGFRIEWWYLTANLTGADGVDYGCNGRCFAARPHRKREPAGKVPRCGWDMPPLPRPPTTLSPKGWRGAESGKPG